MGLVLRINVGVRSMRDVAPGPKGLIRIRPRLQITTLRKSGDFGRPRMGLVLRIHATLQDKENRPLIGQHAWEK